MLNTKIFSNLIFSLLIASSSLSAAEVKFKGQYDVPVEEDLVPFAKFPLDGIEFQDDKFKYHLPSDLAEMPGEEITFKRVDIDGDLSVYRSEFGIAECRFLDKPITRCDIDYNKKLSDILIEGKDEVFQRLIDQGIQGEALIKRMTVIDGFSGDPIGILYIHRDLTIY